jgi:hypothetical protein
LKKASAPQTAKGSGRDNGSANRESGVAREPQRDRRGTEKIVHGGRAPAVDSATGASAAQNHISIIESGDPLASDRSASAPIRRRYTMHYKNLAAVVSDAPLEVLDRRARTSSRTNG